MLAFCAEEASTSATQAVGTVTSPNLTFTLLGSIQDTSSANRSTYSVWYAVAGSALTNEAIHNSVGVGDAAAMVVSSWSGVNTASPFDVGFTQGHNFVSSSAPTIPAITTLTANAVIVAFASGPSGLAISNFPVSSGFTDLSGFSATGTNNGQWMRSEYRAVATPATVGPETFSASPMWAAAALALLPAAPAAAVAQPQIVVMQ